MQSAWRKVRNTVGVFLLLVIIQVIYFKIRDAVGSKQNDKIIVELSDVIKNNRVKLVDFAIYLDSLNVNSGVYKLSEFKGDVVYQANGGFDSSIFIEKSRMQELFNNFGITAVFLEDTCDHQKIFSFTYSKFYPRNRSVKIHFYPKHICDSAFITRNPNPDGLTWQFYYDSLFTIDSKETE
jgi:hypothetical protein